MENGLTHQLVNLRNMILPLQIIHEAFLNIVVQQLTLSNKRIDFLLTNFPRNSIDEHCILDGVVLAEHWILLVVFAVEDFDVSINKQIHLKHGKVVKVFQNKEQLELMRFHRVAQRHYQDVHHFRIEVRRIHES